MIDAQNALDQLLIDHATEGLDDPRRQQLHSYQQTQGGRPDDGFEWAAAALDVACTEMAGDATEPLPESLRRRVGDQAIGYFAARQAASSSASEAAPGSSRGAGAEVIPFPGADDAAASHDPARPGTSSAMPNRGGWAGWAVAVAASLLAILGWAPRIAEQMAGPATEIAGGPSGEPPQAALDATTRRQQLLGQGRQVVQAAWTGTEDPAARGVSGDLVWSPELQEGYMLFNGLPVNDPSEWQYQLWIFDRRQDERYPVDGGVFDVRSDGSVVVPIRTQLEIDEPYLFAITIEKPGGVVVSSRERLPLIATL